MTRSLLEQWLPAATIGAESLRDASAAKKPPNNRLHVWWARRPLTASRAAIVASLLPAWPSEQEAGDDARTAKVLAGLRTEFPGGEQEYRDWFVRSLGILGDPVAGRKAIAQANDMGLRLKDGGYGYPRAFTVSPGMETLTRIHRLAGLRADVSEPPVILDPFAGGGSIPFEAARYRCQTIANELNPVAVAVLHATVTLPRSLGLPFVNQLEAWGARWVNRVSGRLAPFFPRTGDESISAYIWAHTVPCPTTGHPTPLAPDFWLARGKAGRNVAIRLHVNNGESVVQTEIVEGAEAERHGGRSTYKNGTGVSVWTGETFSGEYIRGQARAGNLNSMLLAVSITQPGRSGRQFRAPTTADHRAIAMAEGELARRLPAWEIDDLVPTEDIDHVSNYDRGHRMYGINRWADFFSARQLLSHVVALEELHNVANEARTELGAKQATALSLYLAMALDKAVNFNGRQASWIAPQTKIRSVFDRHNFAFKWSFAEFDGAHSLIPWAVDQVVDAYKGVARLTATPAGLLQARDEVAPRIILGSATDLPRDLLPDNSVDVIVTDPPYYDNVMYAECSDYFYVWLKRALRDTWPDLCTQVFADREQEAVANPALFKDVVASTRAGRRSGGGKTAADLADANYERLLKQAFSEVHRVLKPDGVFTIMFTHKRVDAWDTLGAALLDAGFSIHSSWPVHTEFEHSLHQARKNAASSTIFLACGKRSGTEPAYWSDIRRQVERVAEETAQRLAEDGMHGVDLTIATYGPVLSVLSQRWPVYTGALDDQGQPELLRPDAALDLARERVATLKKRGLLGGRQVEFDRVTDWYLLAWNDFAAAEFPTGEALKLSLATHLELDDLTRTHKLITASSGFVTLLTPAQRRTAGAFDPDALDWPTMVDALHALMLLYSEDGLIAAKAWVERTRYGEDPRFRALIHAALRAIPRTKEKDQFVRPEARALEGLRATLFDDIPPPPSEDDSPKNIAMQGALDI